MSTQTEAKAKAELLRIKKKLEADINDLEIALDHANKTNSDIQKSLKRNQEQIRELQLQVEEEQRQRDEVRDQFFNAEKRATVLQQEKDEIRHAYNNTERDRKDAELAAQEARDQANELAAQAASMNAQKRKLEGEIQALHTDLDDTLREFKQAEENAKKVF